MTSRDEFEAKFTQFPYEYSAERFSEDSAWPDQYIDSDMELAWQAWQESAKLHREQMKKECIEAIQIECNRMAEETGVSPSYNVAIAVIEKLE